MNNRNRDLLDLAHALETCTGCRAWCPHGLEPAHENGIEAGKGFGIKSHDNRHAALCHGCHVWYDQGQDAVSIMVAEIGEKVKLPMYRGDLGLVK